LTAVHEGIRSWELLADDRGWMGVSWFAVDHAGPQVLAVPRLVGIVPLPDEEFGKLVAKLLFANNDPAAVLLPPRMSGPSALVSMRVAELRACLTAPLPGPRAPFSAPFPTLLRLLDGKGDAGAPSTVDLHADRWVKLTMRRDVLSRTFADVAEDEDLRSITGVAPGVTTDLRHARGHMYETRRRLHDAGAIPWALWPKGTVPHGWAYTERFVAGLERWRAERERLRLSSTFIDGLKTHYAALQKARHEALRAAERTLAAGGSGEAATRAYHRSWAPEKDRAQRRLE
jgi:hypothetical protein